MVGILVCSFLSMTHPELVKALLKPAQHLWAVTTVGDINLMHLEMGIVGEAGEISDAIKKHVIYRKPLDISNLIEELGDLEFYMEALRQHLGLSRDGILAANIAKLQKRYADGYSDRAAHERADKL